MESQNQFEELDDRAYTESFDDVMTICPRLGMTAQERYEFRKNNKPALTKNNQEKLNPKDVDNLIVQLRSLEDTIKAIERKNTKFYLLLLVLSWLDRSSSSQYRN
jgi:hypothetical protein